MSLSVRHIAYTAASVLLSAACTDSTGPDARFPVEIAGIDVPETAAPNDTVRIRFLYEAGCGEREIVLRMRHDRLEVGAFGFALAPGMLCPGWIDYLERTVLIPPAERGVPYTVVFAQPSGVDSVRIIHPVAATMDAP